MNGFCDLKSKGKNQINKFFKFCNYRTTKMLKLFYAQKPTFIEF